MDKNSNPNASSTATAAEGPFHTHCHACNYARTRTLRTQTRRRRRGGRSPGSLRRPVGMSLGREPARAAPFRKEKSRALSLIQLGWSVGLLPAPFPGSGWLRHELGLWAAAAPGRAPAPCQGTGSGCVLSVGGALSRRAGAGRAGACSGPDAGASPRCQCQWGLGSESAVRVSSPGSAVAWRGGRSAAFGGLSLNCEEAEGKRPAAPAYGPRRCTLHSGFKLAAA